MNKFYGSSYWLEYFADGPNAGFFAPAIEDTERLLVPSITIIEVFKRVLRQRGEIEALEKATMMRLGYVVDLDSTLAVSAAKIGFELKLALADSVGGGRRDVSAGLSTTSMVESQPAARTLHLSPSRSRTENVPSGTCEEIEKTALSHPLSC